MKLKIMLIVLLCFSVGIAQQKDKKVKADKGKWEELKEYPKPISPIQPEYPQVAKLAGIEGKVYVEALISEKGNVVNTKILKSEHESLIMAAVDAIVKTKFSPGISKDNKKVQTWVVIPISFKLDDKEKKSDTTLKAPDNETDPEMNTFQEVEKLPEMVEAATPDYPEEAKKNKITGKAFVKVLVDKEGNPKKAVVIKSDNELFNQPAIDAALKSKFTPAMQAYKPIAVWIVLPYRFTLDGKENGLSDKFETVEQAKKEYDTWIYYNSNPQEAKKIGDVPSAKAEKVETDVKFGDESAVYKLILKGSEKFGFFARKGKEVYRFFGKSMEEIQNYVDKLNKTEN
ncbi:MAG: energy transducer TonB [Melioribacteraceae bacterium]